MWHEIWFAGVDTKISVPPRVRDTSATPGYVSTSCTPAVACIGDFRVASSSDLILVHWHPASAAVEPKFGVSFFAFKTVPPALTPRKPLDYKQQQQPLYARHTSDAHPLHNATLGVNNAGQKSYYPLVALAASRCILTLVSVEARRSISVAPIG